MIASTFINFIDGIEDDTVEARREADTGRVYLWSRQVTVALERDAQAVLAELLADGNTPAAPERGVLAVELSRALLRCAALEKALRGANGRLGSHGLDTVEVPS